MSELIFDHEYEADSGTLYICIGGRLDSGTADEFSAKLSAVRAEYPDGTIVFDLDSLTYITSMGLRRILTLSSEVEYKVRAVNVSPEVMEIFRMTGFDSILDVSPKMREISIEGCEVIGRGSNGRVCRLDQDTIIKVFFQGTDLSIVERERKRARAALMKGLPTAISYDVVRAGDCYGIVYELIDSTSFSAVLSQDEEHFDRYAERYTALFRELHSTEGDEETFGLARTIYEEAIEYCRGWYTEQETENLRSLIRSIPDRRTLIHGDYHPNNIMLIDGELTLIDMGDLSLGHPVYDFIATAATQVNLVKLDPDFARKHTGMSVRIITRLWNSLLEGYFAQRSKEDIRKIDRLMGDLAKIKVALAPYFARDIDKELVAFSVNDAKKNLLPKTAQLLSCLNEVLEWF